MRFPKPAFSDLVDNYLTDPESVHDCPYIHTKAPINVNTCAIRMGEALVIANNLVKDREAITKLTKNAGSGKSFLMGRYGYRANLCPHGISRGARDVADFLRQQWGKPDRTWEALGDAPDEIADQTGVLSFVKIPGYTGQGHMDLWNMSTPVGHAYWDSAKIAFWRLD